MEGRIGDEDIEGVDYLYCLSGKDGGGTSLTNFSYLTFNWEESTERNGTEMEVTFSVLWCYRRMLKVSSIDRMSNTEVWDMTREERSR